MDYILQDFCLALKEKNFDTALYNYFVFNRSVLSYILLAIKDDSQLQNILLQLIDGDTDSHSIIIIFLNYVGKNFLGRELDSDKVFLWRPSNVINDINSAQTLDNLVTLCQKDYVYITNNFNHYIKRIITLMYKDFDNNDNTNDDTWANLLETIIQRYCYVNNNKNSYPNLVINSLWYQQLCLIERLLKFIADISRNSQIKDSIIEQLSIKTNNGNSNYDGGNDKMVILNELLNHKIVEETNKNKRLETTIENKEQVIKEKDKVLEQKQQTIIDLQSGIQNTNAKNEKIIKEKDDLYRQSEEEKQDIWGKLNDLNNEYMNIVKDKDIIKQRQIRMKLNTDDIIGDINENFQQIQKQREEQNKNIRDKYELENINLYDEIKKLRDINIELDEKCQKNRDIFEKTKKTNEKYEKDFNSLFKYIIGDDDDDASPHNTKKFDKILNRIEHFENQSMDYKRIKQQLNEATEDIKNYSAVKEKYESILQDIDHIYKNLPPFSSSSSSPPLSGLDMLRSILNYIEKVTNIQQELDKCLYNYSINIDQLTADNHLLKEEINKEKEVKKLEYDNQYYKLFENFKQLETSFEHLSSENNDLKLEIKNLKSDFKKENEYNDQLNKELEMITKKKEYNENSILEQDNVIKGLNNDLMQITQTNSKFIDENQKLKNDLKKQKEMTAELENQLISIYNKLDDINEKEKSLGKMLSTTRHLLDQSNNSY